MRRYLPSLFSEEKMWKSSFWLLAALLPLTSACILDNPDVPDLAGPSVAARSIEIRAIPDTIVSDGFSSSVIEAVMRGPNGERVAGATILFELVAAGTFLDLGNLAPLNGARPAAGGVESGPVSAVTDGDGVARARYWAPFRTDQENDTRVTIAARESGTNTRGVLFAQADIFLRAANRPSFPGSSLCGFTIEPNRPFYRIGESIAFTATQSTGDVDGNDRCLGNEIARYEWNIEPITYKAGREIVHAFSAAGDFTIELITTEAISGCQSICTATVSVVP
jgi:hypothetical protein